MKLKFPFITICILTGGISAAGCAQTIPTPEVSWADVAPIFINRCSSCHSGQLPAALLRLDSREGLLKGSQIGSVVKAGDPKSSILMRRIEGSIRPRMPMNGPPFLTNDEVSRIRSWIEQGLAE